MVKGLFKVSKNDDSSTGWSIEALDIYDVDDRDAVARAIGKELDLPSIIIDELKTKNCTGQQRLEKIDKLVLVLAGVTYSLNVKNADYYDRNSVLISFDFLPGQKDDPEVESFANKVKGTFKVIRDTSATNEWLLSVIKLYGIDDTDLIDTTVDLPKVFIEYLKGKALSGIEMLLRIDTITATLYAISNELYVDNQDVYNEDSVIESFTINPIAGSIDEAFKGVEFESVKDYEKYHIIKMGRDVAGNDSTIHAYIETPKDGRLRSLFDRSVKIDDTNIRTFAKRNNIQYWVEDYRVEERSAGGKFVRPILPVPPREIT